MREFESARPPRISAAGTEPDGHQFRKLLGAEHSTAALPGRGARQSLGASKSVMKGMCRMRTLFASDRVVYRSDWAGLLMFSGLPSDFKGWNAIRVPPRAQ